MDSLTPFETALRSLTAVARHHRVNTSPEQIRRAHPAAAGTPADALPTLVAAARAIGLKARSLKTDFPALPPLQDTFPALARLNNGNWVVLVGLRGQGEEAAVAVLDPLATPADAVFLIDRARFEAAWSGDLVLVTRVYSLHDENRPFGLGWFVPELLRQKAFLRDVAVAALVLHVLALAMPVFTQLVIDKVIVHQGYSTLYVLTAGVILALLFEAAFSYLRQTFMLQATNRLDVRLARKTFAHLLRLPITFFETGTAGVITRHMQQAEKIRQFLTGRLFSTLLDASVLVLLLPVMFFYSGLLATLVLAFAAAIGAVVVALIPAFRARLQALYSAEAERQSLLVETIQGMRTVKALAVEPLRRDDWDARSARTVALHFRVGRISLAAHTAMSLLEKLMGVSVIAVGANLVFDQTLSVGSLIAFQMLSGRVVSPLVQIVALVHEYQETALSVRMLGEIMNRPVEGQRASGGLEPTLEGHIAFENVSFRYAPGAAAALEQISFSLPAGKVVGVVGRSGSGKTTLTRLMQGLYPVQDGIVRFDGIDLREIDLAHLRRQIGVVLQDNFLFRGTVRDNLSITRPTAGFDEIVAAARLAGADEFIERLPQGYDTLLEENAANLSGGQRQRLAIARALLNRPRILILDEAASALDPESEAIFLNNLAGLTAGRTVIIVSHRLSALTRADAIMVLDRGHIVDAGRHEELLGRCAVYTQLWNQQTRHL
ncbi:MAG TPA: peptidase domain-containing ABC transporter [Zoogloea sp.]|uniref:peptidase domain-containing ABC transporter n=1 Tax=Zoogloea sp. TaxID=49181 RepID=UPI002C6CDDB8|nr:peptidase domain-containing ABC transporter [Zoogloea sp.]HMZ77431.1 peptidase domain-containing ABC transporter [Rhodocyclaceae bacterium]HNB65537.1 peptidase domain-containing ABC transporter [Rhodocyclaceae bacterium]HND25482.1 peptidase domain-containing ABC transporter [Rhodocyclaceae bacterium]HNE16899.1 peptidase domain-containing ABC transporter [Rhodocyclaceae bacterium]HNF62908.1 peptidase domain-containing ABC transporter [Rhodocyclaceae bacterium]